MNDSTNGTPGDSGTPEPADNTALPQDDQATVEQPTVEADEQPTTELPADGLPADAEPTAHTLPHRTGPTPAHYVNEATTGQPAAADDFSHMGQDGYANQYGAQQYAQQAYGQAPVYPATPTGHMQNQYGQAPYGYDQNGRPVYAIVPNGYPQAGYGQVPPAFQKPKRQHKRWMTVTGAALAGVLIAGAAGGGAYAIGISTGQKAADTAGQSQTLQLPGGSSGSGSSGSSNGFGGGSFGSGGSGSTGGSGATGGSGSTGTVPTDATAATAAEKVGLVTIVSTLDYNESSKSAGTGMIMTSDGEILTNNHVIQGATSIQVTVVSTGKTYTAKVVGTDATNDVAVLKLEGASGLDTVSFGKNATVSTGDSIHSTGNAEGTGSLVTAKGTVVATKQSIQVQSESGSGTESLSNLIEISADVVSGDSGGPLRNADGKVIGIVTAASSGTTAVTGYAIPISSALSIATKILAGESSSTIVIGLPAFLGAQISSTSTGTTGAGVTIAGTVSGSAAAKAGLVAGDTITAIDGTAVADATALTTAIQAHKAGDSAKVTYTDSAGASHTITVTLGEGPAA